MPKRQDDPTTDDANRSETTNPLSRRRVLQLSGVGLATGALATAGVSAGSGELPNTIVFDGTETAESASYEFLTSEAVTVHPSIGSNGNPGDVNGGHVKSELGAEVHAYQFSGHLSYLDVDGTAEVRLRYGDDTAPETDRLEIVASSDGEVDYEIVSEDRVRKVTDNGDRSADDDDTVTQTEDGTWLVDGSTQNGNGDTYEFHGEIERFEPVTGAFTLFWNGEERTVTDLTGQEPLEEESADEEETNSDREHWYSFEATGDEYADYYFEVEEDGDLLASEVDDATVSAEYQWINDDGTKAAGRIHPGETHAYEFDTIVADVTIEGEAEATVNGSSSNLDYYPRDVATGDHWKGFFPWQLEGEERTHWYSFEATGDEYADYYFEVEEGGDLIPSTVDDALIEYEFFWISNDGTKAAGRVQPGDTHAYEFDTLVADVTIEGDADATVNGNSSNLDYYPRDVATGDGWKTGFPWQDSDHDAPREFDSDADVGIRHDSYDGPLGGGSGMPDSAVYDRSDADIVVTDGNVDGALNQASRGDVIYVDGSASSFTANVAHVTIAGNRGVGSDGRISGAPSVSAPGVTFDGLTINYHGGTTGVNATDLTITNCELYNNGTIGLNIDNSAVTVEQSYIHDFGSIFDSGTDPYYRGGSVSACGSSYRYTTYDNRIILRYCELENLGRHGIIGTNNYWEITDCYAHGSLGGSGNDSLLDVRAPNQCRVTGSGSPNACGSPCGSAILEHNRHEMYGGGGKARLVVVRGTPGGVDNAQVVARNNVCPGNSRSNGGCWENGTAPGWSNQVVYQNASDTSGLSENVTVSNNQI